MWFIFLWWLSGGTHPHEAVLNDGVITFEPLVKGWFSAIEFVCLIWNFCFVAVYKLRSLPVQTQLSCKPGGDEMKIRTVQRLGLFFYFFYFLMRSVRHGHEFAATWELSPESAKPEFQQGSQTLWDPCECCMTWGRGTSSQWQQMLPAALAHAVQPQRMGEFGTGLWQSPGESVLALGCFCTHRDAWGRIQNHRMVWNSLSQAAQSI